jgi:4-amino-4-deoxy-L-arabinose transferase-like glycosyltransferase
MTRYRAALAAVAIVAGVVAICFSWQPGLASLFDDSVSYLLMAQAFSPFHGPSPVVLEAARYERYPPFFPFLLAISHGAFDWRLAHALVATCFAASVFLLGVHTRAISGSARLAVVAAIIYAILPGTWLNLKGILSEFPYMALTFAALAFHQHRRDKPPDAKSSIALGLLLAAVLLTRSVGVTLVAAVAIDEGLHYLRTRERTRLRGLVLALAFPLFAGALWFALRPVGGGEDPYESAWTLLSIGVNASALVDAWLNALLIYWGEPWMPAFIGACAIGLAGLSATLWRAFHGESDGLYCVLFLLALLSWPYPGQMYRLAFPIVPLLIVNALWSVRQQIGRRWDVAAAERWTPVVALLPLALCTPALFFIATRASATEQAGAGDPLADIAEFYRIPDWRSAVWTATMELGVLEDMERIRGSTPESSRIMWFVPAYMALLANRRGALLERSVNADALAKQVLDSRAEYIYLANVHPRDSRLRHGNPLDDLGNARAFTQVMWQRGAPSGQVYAVLLKVDRDGIERAHGANP